MKTWVVVYLDQGAPGFPFRGFSVAVSVKSVSAENVIQALNLSEIDPKYIVSIHCVNTEASIG